MKIIKEIFGIITLCFLAVYFILLPALLSAETQTIQASTALKPETTGELLPPGEAVTFEIAPSPEGTKAFSFRPIPEFAKWEENMKAFGEKHMAPMPPGVGWEGSVWYYDGIKVYYQIAAYTGDNKSPV